MCLYSQFLNNTMKTIDDIDFEPPILKHGMQSKGKIGTFYRIFIKKCQNKTYNNFKCLPKEDIDKYLENKVLSFELIDNYFDVTNYTIPVTKYINGIGELYNKDNYIRNSINLQRAKIITNKGLIFDDKEEIISYSFEQNEKVTARQVFH